MQRTIEAVEVDWADNDYASPDRSVPFMEYSVQYGIDPTTNEEFLEPVPASGDVLIDNASGKWFSESPSAFNATQLRKRHKCRITSTWGNATTVIWEGIANPPTVGEYAESNDVVRVRLESPRSGSVRRRISLMSRLRHSKALAAVRAALLPFPHTLANTRVTTASLGTIFFEGTTRQYLNELAKVIFRLCL